MRIGQIDTGSGAIGSNGKTIGYYWVELVSGTYVERIVLAKSTWFPFLQEVTFEKPTPPMFSPVKASAFKTWAASKLSIPESECATWKGEGWKGPDAF